MYRPSATHTNDEQESESEDMENQSEDMEQEDSSSASPDVEDNEESIEAPTNFHHLMDALSAFHQAAHIFNYDNDAEGADMALIDAHQHFYQLLQNRIENMTHEDHRAVLAEIQRRHIQLMIDLGLAVWKDGEGHIEDHLPDIESELSNAVNELLVDDNITHTPPNSDMSDALEAIRWSANIYKDELQEDNTDLAVIAYWHFHRILRNDDSEAVLQQQTNLSMDLTMDNDATLDEEHTDDEEPSEGQSEIDDAAQDLFIDTNTEQTTGNFNHLLEALHACRQAAYIYSRDFHQEDADLPLLAAHQRFIDLLQNSIDTVADEGQRYVLEQIQQRHNEVVVDWGIAVWVDDDAEEPDENPMIDDSVEQAPANFDTLIDALEACRRTANINQDKIDQDGSDAVIAAYQYFYRLLENSIAMEALEDSTFELLQQRQMNLSTESSLATLDDDVTLDEQMDIQEPSDESEIDQDNSDGDAAKTTANSDDSNDALEAFRRAANIHNHEITETEVQQRQTSLILNITISALDNDTTLDEEHIHVEVPSEDQSEIEQNVAQKHIINDNDPPNFKQLIEALLACRQAAEDNQELHQDGVDLPLMIAHLHFHELLQNTMNAVTHESQLDVLRQIQQRHNQLLVELGLAGRDDDEDEDDPMNN